MDMEEICRIAQENVPVEQNMFRYWIPLSSLMNMTNAAFKATSGRDEEFSQISILCLLARVH